MKRDKLKIIKTLNSKLKNILIKDHEIKSKVLEQLGNKN